MAAAYEAYHDSLDGKPAAKIDGFTGDQQFFIAFGQNWGSKVRPACCAGRSSPIHMHRLNIGRATVRNSDAWYSAFDVMPGQSLYLAPDKRVRIW